MKPSARYKKQLIAAASVALTAASACCQQPAATPSGFELKRGVNLSHWLSQNVGWPPKASFITEKDIEFIAGAGYDHVRIPIDEVEMWSPDGKPSAESFAYLTRCLDWCAKHNLRAVVDLHVLKAHHFNAANEGGKITL